MRASRATFRLSSTVLVFILCMGVAPPASADPAPAESSWYGWQTLIVDAGSVAVAALGWEKQALSAVGVGGYLLGGPIVHAVHGRGISAAGSLGLRLAAPLVGAVIGYEAGGGACQRAKETDRTDPADGLGAAFGALAGASVGVLGAIILDAALLARETQPSTPSRVQLALGPPRDAGLAMFGAF
jgi:hypothetical protein